MRSAPALLTGLLLLFSLFLPAAGNGQDKPAVFLSIHPKEVKLKIGREVTIRVEVHGAKDLFGAPFYLLYNPKALEVLKVNEGAFLKQDGKNTTFLHKVDKEKGWIVIGLTRLGDIGGVSGKGTLVTMTFRALWPGRAIFSFEKVDFRDSRLNVLTVQLSAARVEILRTTAK